MTNIIEKKRKKVINLENLNPDQVELAGEELGKKIGHLGEEAAKKVNKLIKIYGLRAKVVIQLIDEKTGLPVD